MTYAIDEIAPWMWIFFIVLIIVAVVSTLHYLYVWVAEDPCAAYELIARYWGRIGDHCVK